MSLEVLLILLVTVLITVIFYLLSKTGGKSGEIGELRMLKEYMFDLRKTFDEKLDSQNKMMFDNIIKNFDTNSQISKDSNNKIEEITKKLVELTETNKQIKDIGGQLDGLEKILRNPKQRGNLGEYFLKELLENVFQEGQYATQYKLSSGAVIDAVLFLGGKNIPIDSKFPQENYERLIVSEDDISKKKYALDLKSDIKKRIDETSKYVQLENNTTDFAFMLIPAEGLYYDIFIAKVGGIDARALVEYAFSKKVIVCSPSSFYAYLQTVIQGLKALKVEEQAKEILAHVNKLSKDLERYEDVFGKLGNSLGATVNHYNSAAKRLSIIDKDIMKISQGESGGHITLQEIEKPD